MPLDEALSRVVIDLSGRPGLEFHVPFTRAMIGAFDVDLAHEFFQGFVNHAQVTLHVDNLRGDNAHHQAETVFKAFGRALRMAVARRSARGRRRAVDQRGTVARSVGRHAASPRDADSRAMTDIAVVDYGMGNLRSVAKALQHVAPERSIVVSADPAVIRAAARVVLPGQSAMPDCIRSLDASGLREVVLEAARTRPVPRHLPRPADAVRGERGGAHALPRAAAAGASCAFATTTMALPSGERLKVPHMGWSPVRQARPHPLWAGIADGTRFYFAHSYHPRARRSRA